jgi:hypothetical protein
MLWFFYRKKLQMEGIKTMKKSYRSITQFNKGRKDYINKKGCLSANGSYLNGYYYQHDQR